jgi:hypothetical protein
VERAEDLLGAKGLSSGISRGRGLVDSKENLLNLNSVIFGIFSRRTIITAHGIGVSKEVVTRPASLDEEWMK